MLFPPKSSRPYNTFLLHSAYVTWICMEMPKAWKLTRADGGVGWSVFRGANKCQQNTHTRVLFHDGSLQHKVSRFTFFQCNKRNKCKSWELLYRTHSQKHAILLPIMVPKCFESVGGVVEETKGKKEQFELLLLCNRRVKEVENVTYFLSH